MNQLDFPIYEQDIICIYCGIKSDCTRTSVMKRITENLSAIDDADIKADVLIVLRKLKAMSETEFQDLLENMESEQG